MNHLSKEDQARVALGLIGKNYTVKDFLDAAGAGDLVVVTLFVRVGMSVNATDNAGYTALMQAAANGHLEVVKYLVGLEADVQAKSKNGMTARDWAGHSGHLAAVEYFDSLGDDE